MLEFYRLFMVPGMAHCRGGDGVSTFEMMAALEHWVERGKAPAQVMAVNDLGFRTRPLCPFPQVSRYKGSGDQDEAASFACVVPK